MNNWIRPLSLVLTIGLVLGAPLAAHADPKHGRGHDYGHGGHDRHWVPPGHRVDYGPRVVYLEPQRPRVIVIERPYRPPVYAIPVDEPSINVIFPINLR
ncbi:hypothetical protein [Magnetospirillum sp. 64-120]|uniref:hypothetical protein n=1 Tax=Magnetospirillum sp. 64-120 TaxID=1895778 RepID=UPI00092C42F0|nr:hypothetical protein [Magnetospirillum sp. 64-120]OJX79441.1 MAG: hypothetical protein BGO92_13270 [Magnetospirillum sp. 64-120]